MTTTLLPRSARWARVLALTIVGALALAACSTTDTPERAAPATTAVAVPDGPPPEQPGPYAVGRTTVTLNDPTRPERALVTDLWYPLDPAAAVGARASTYEFLPGLGYDSSRAVSGVPVSPAGPFPLVIFSHGSTGLRWQSAFFTELLASHGFVVASTDHVGNTAADSILGSSVTLEQSAVDRPKDVALVIDALLAGSNGAPADLVTAIDPGRIGISGHSFGGYTGLASASGRPGIPADGRIKAVLGLAAWTEPLSDAELEAVEVPTMLLSGTLDTTTTISDNTERAWSLIPGRPFYRIDITGAGHQSFTDTCLYQELARARPDAPAALVSFIDELATAACEPRFLAIGTAHELVTRYGIAFLEAYVAGDTSATAWLTPEAAQQTPEVALQVKE